MAFLFPDKKPEELSDLEIVEDFLLTQFVIETHLRKLAEDVKATDHSKRYPSLPSKLLFGKVLFEVLVETEPYLFMNSSERYKCIFLDLSCAWVKYEHLERCFPIEECIREESFKDPHSGFYLRDKYMEYNHLVMPYYDYFMKTSVKEQLTLLNPKNKD